jgi:hypothetical protein
MNASPRNHAALVSDLRIQVQSRFVVGKFSLGSLPQLMTHENHCYFLADFHPHSPVLFFRRTTHDQCQNFGSMIVTWLVSQTVLRQLFSRLFTRRYLVETLVLSSLARHTELETHLVDTQIHSNVCFGSSVAVKDEYGNHYTCPAQTQRLGESPYALACGTKANLTNSILSSLVSSACDDCKEGHP